MTVADYIQGLRDLADWLERHEGDLDRGLRNDVGKLLLYASDKDDFVKLLALLEGQGEHSHDHTYFKVARRFGPVEVQVYSNLDKLGAVTKRMQSVEVTDWQPDSDVAELLQPRSQVPA